MKRWVVSHWRALARNTKFRAPKNFFHRRLTGSALFFCFLASAAIWALPVLAAEEEGGKWGIWEPIGRFFNLFLLVGVLVYFVRKPLGAFFENRRREIKEQLAQAEIRRREAGEKVKEIEQRMQRIEEDLAALRERARQEIVDEAARVEESARQQSEKILSVAHREIDGILKNAQKELKRYAGSLSVDMAEGMIRKEVGSADHERIFESSIHEVEKMKS